MAEKEVTPEGVRRSTRQTVMTETNMREELKRFEEEIKKLFKQPIAETHQDELIKTSKSLKLYLAQYQKISRDLVKNLKLAASISDAQEVAENRRHLKEDVNEHLDLIKEVCQRKIKEVCQSKIEEVCQRKIKEVCKRKIEEVCQSETEEVSQSKTEECNKSKMEEVYFENIVEERLDEMIGKVNVYDHEYSYNTEKDLVEIPGIFNWNYDNNFVENIVDKKSMEEDVVHTTVIYSQLESDSVKAAELVSDSEKAAELVSDSVEAAQLECDSVEAPKLESDLLNEETNKNLPLKLLSHKESKELESEVNNEIEIMEENSSSSENSKVGDLVTVDMKVKIDVDGDEIFVSKYFDEFNEEFNKLIKLLNINGFEQVDGNDENCRPMYEAWIELGGKCIYSPSFETYNKRWKSNRRKRKKKKKTEPRNSWPLARITEPKVSTDGLVRSALVNCQGKVFNRAVTDMVYIMST